MADSRKYYYMKLKEDFFDSEEMIMLETFPDGILYQNILMKLYCRSLKNEGRLMFNDIIPYNADMIAKITRTQVGTVEKALKIFAQMGLIEVLENGAIYMMNIQNFIGKSSTEADRKREYRSKIESEKQLLIGQKSGQMSRHSSGHSEDISPPEIEIEIENRDKINNTSADLQSAIESEFDVLWKMYPNKKDKAKALKAYKKARTAKKNPVQFETVKYGVEAYVRETRDTDIKYIKHGSTWFNSECWKDYEEQKTTEERIEQNTNVDPYSGGRNDF